MIIANFNEDLTTKLIFKNSTILDSNNIDLITFKGGYDFEDCCCDETCSCGGGHNHIELTDKMTTSNMTENLNSNNTSINDLNNIALDNLVLDQSDISIPILALPLSIIFSISLMIGVCQGWKALNIKKDNLGKTGKGNNKLESRLLDAPLSWGLYFQDGASPSFEGIVDLHNRIMFYLVVILFGVSWVLLSLMTNFNKSNNKLVYRHLNHGTLIELVWTVGPALVLVAIAFPSFKLLYLMDIFIFVHIYIEYI